jgi:hypothetical protein
MHHSLVITVRLGARFAGLFMEIFDMDTLKKIDLVLGIALKIAGLTLVIVKLAVFLGTGLNYRVNFIHAEMVPEV